MVAYGVPIRYKRLPLHKLYGAGTRHSRVIETHTYLDLSIYNELKEKISRIQDIGIEIFFLDTRNDANGFFYITKASIHNLEHNIIDYHRFILHRISYTFFTRRRMASDWYIYKAYDDVDPEKVKKIVIYGLVNGTIGEIDPIKYRLDVENFNHFYRFARFNPFKPRLPEQENSQTNENPRLLYHTLFPHIVRELGWDLETSQQSAPISNPLVPTSQSSSTMVTSNPILTIPQFNPTQTNTMPRHAPRRNIFTPEHPEITPTLTHVSSVTPPPRMSSPLDLNP